MPETPDTDPAHQDDCSDPVIMKWGHGKCHALTLALHRRTGWQILTLHDNNHHANGPYLADFGFVVHSGVLHPDGGFIDIRGKHGPGELRRVAALYLDYPRAARWAREAAPDEDDLLDIMLPEDKTPGILSEAEQVIDDRLAHLLDLPCGPTP